MRHPLVRGLAVYLVLPNLAFFLVGRCIYLLRPLINADYLLAWILSSYLSRRASILLYCILLVLDLILSGAAIYHFSTADVILNAHYLADLNLKLAYPAVAGMLLLLAAAFVLKSKSPEAFIRHSRRSQMVLILVTTASFSVPIAHALYAPESRFDHISKPVIVESRVAEVAQWGVDTVLGDERYEDPRADMAANSWELWRDVSLSAGTVPPYNIVLILVESEGLLRNPEDMHRVFEPLLNASVNARYAIRSGAVPFEGATVSGEFRVLCRIHAWEANLADLRSLPPCLPKLLKERGYLTLSYHANTGRFFDRPPWYRALGFQHSYFKEQLASMVAKPFVNCGYVFKGVCDLGIADVIERELRQPAPNKKFIYWLTYNSHLPVDSGLARQSAFDCGFDKALSAHAGPCDLARIHYELHQAIARLALDAELPPTRFIIVGDHMPPFATLAERALYDDGHVPFIDLIPREAPAIVAAQSR